MNAGNLIFLLLIVGSFAAMFSMHRGGHGHGGMSGGCGGHGGQRDDEKPAEGGHGGHGGHEEHGQAPVLGPPGTAGNDPAPAAQGRRQHGC